VRVNYSVSALAIALISSTACGRHDPVAAAPVDTSQLITAAQAYTPHVGDVWTFVNGYGDTTTVTSEAPPDPVACHTGNNIIWHYRKNNARAYWNPTVDGAELLFVLHQNSDSSWRSIASVISFPHSCAFCTGGWTEATYDVRDNPAGVPLPYQIIPPTLHATDHTIAETLADAGGGTGISTLTCALTPDALVAQPGHGEEWRTEYYMEDVSTPIYTGPASVSEQWENCNADRTDVGCGHEKWWFAPGLGLVKVQQIDTGSGHEGDEDPKITMLRVK
jgi:hypothetical protein